MAQEPLFEVGDVRVHELQEAGIGRLTHSVRVMAKPLADRSLDDYLAQVPRDRPET